MGNPVAVVLDGEGLSSEQMQAMAAWTNLSETTFVLPPDHPGADYRVRIFTPDDELPFAGHPTLGTCHAWMQAGGRSKRGGVIVQECGAGLVEVRPGDDGSLAFAAPPLIRSGDVEEELLTGIAGSIGLARGDIVDAQWVDNGPGWAAVLLQDAQAVLDVVPGDVFLDLGLVGLYPPGGDVAVELRALYPQNGSVVEDPVTGSLNASVAGWLLATGRLAAPYTATQGTAIGRAGRIRITQDRDGTVWTGGQSVTVVRGTVVL
jgi:PhzF family phenazine biosynthesis protein